MKVYHRGESIYVYAETRDLSGNLVNVTSVACSIYDPLNTKVVSSTAIANTATGKYGASVATGAAWLRGKYLLRVEVTNGADLIYATEEVFLEILNDE